MLLAFVAGTANAGYWEVTYDIEGSTLLTHPPIGPDDIDPITGTFTVQYDTVGSSTSTITGARLVAGHTHVTMNQPIPGLMTITGSTDMTLIPQTGGAPGPFAGAGTINWSIVADSNTTGYLHCRGGSCGLAGMPESVTFPMTPTGTGPFPWPSNGKPQQWIFTGGTVGTGNWTAPMQFQTVQTGLFTVNLEYEYQGREISRTYVPEPASLLVLASGAGLLVLLGWLRRR